MPNIIDTTTVEFGPNFTSDFDLTDTSTWPEGSCTLPTLLPVTLPALSNSLTSVIPDCQFTFSPVLPSPPIFIPQQEINIPCPTGYTFNNNVVFNSIGCGSVDGNLSIVTDPTTPCTNTLQGGLTINFPCPACPDGTSIGGEATLTVQGNGAITLGPDGNPGPITFSIVGGPCEYYVVGGGSIDLTDLIPAPVSNSEPSSVSGECQDCTKTCCDMRTAIEAAYATLGKAPTPGDIIDLCIAAYVVLGSPHPTSECDGSCPSFLTALIIDFTYDDATYYARLVNSQCPPTTPFGVALRTSGGSTQFMLQSDSHLYGSPYNLSPEISITGLGSWTDYDGTGDTYIYLNGSVDAFIVSSASIMTSSTQPNVIDLSGGSQTDFNVPIAKISNGTVIQNTSFNLYIALIVAYDAATQTLVPAILPKQ